MRNQPLVPELTVAFLSFTFHFVWEMLQVPTYEGMSTMEHWAGILVCTQATVGDVGFALTAFWIVAIIRRSRHWIVYPTARDVVVFLAVGIVLTIGFEYYYVEIAHRWAYAPWLPRVPPFGTGLSPFLQWIIVPLLVLTFAKRNLREGQGRSR